MHGTLASSMQLHEEIKIRLLLFIFRTNGQELVEIKTKVNKLSRNVGEYFIINLL